MNPTRILIVDDEATLRTTMAELLAANDREIVTAASGEEALAYIEDQPFDLIIVDLIRSLKMIFHTLIILFRTNVPAV